LLVAAGHFKSLNQCSCSGSSRSPLPTDRFNLPNHPTCRTIYSVFWTAYIAVLAFLIHEGLDAEFFFGLLLMACVFMHTISKPSHPAVSDSKAAMEARNEIGALHESSTASMPQVA
jgi:hypothetical protein